MKNCAWGSDFQELDTAWNEDVLKAVIVSK